MQLTTAHREPYNRHVPVIKTWKANCNYCTMLNVIHSAVLKPQQQQS